MQKMFLALLGSTALIAVGTTVPTHVVAQGVQPSAQQSATQSRTKAASQLSDPQFVRRAAISNMFEIRSSQLAADKSNNEDVQDFAERMIEDHQRSSKNLKSASGDANLPDNLDQRHARMLDRLKQASGNRFDRRFIGMQVRAHRRAVSLFENFAQSAQQQEPAGQQNQAGQRQNKAREQAYDHQALVQFAQETLPTLRQHLKMAQQLRNDLRRAGNRVAGRRDTTDAGQSAGRTLTIRQPSPQVTVQDPRASVTVQQPQPQITIRQAPPTITIQQPKPEIVVQMPKPDVNVRDRQPRVSVDVPKPQLEVAEQGRAQVQMQDREGTSQDQVQFSGARPQVHYQRTGEPRIVYPEAEGEPNVRYQAIDQRQSSGDRGDRGDQSKMTPQSGESEQSAQQAREQRNAAQHQRNAAEDQGSAASGGQQNGQQSASREPTDDWIARAHELAREYDTGEAGTTGSADGSIEPQKSSIAVDRLVDMDVYNSRGQNLGEIDSVVMDSTSSRTYVVLAHGGFLGLFEDEVALPVDRLSFRGDRLVVAGLTEQEIEQMADWEERLPNNRELDDQQTVEVARQ